MTTRSRTRNRHIDEDLNVGGTSRVLHMGTDIPINLF